MKVYAIVLCLLLPFSVRSQPLEPTFRHYGIEEGLPSSEVYMVIQDLKGYMWFATDRGVARFDGYDFEVYTTKEGLCDNSVFGAYEDYKGRIWFFTYSNQLSYYQDGKIYNPKANATLKGLHNFKIPINIYVDEDDVVWINFVGHQQEVDFVKVHIDGRVEFVQLSDQQGQAKLHVKQFASGDYIWRKTNIYDNHQLWYMKGEDTQVFSLDDIPESFKNKYNIGGVSFYSKNADHFLIGYRNHFYEFNQDTLQLKFRLDANNTYGLYIDRRGHTWVATFEKGVLVYGDQDVKQALLEDKEVSWITEDRDGGIWLSTLNDGVFYIPSIDFLCARSVDYFQGQRILDIEAVDGDIYAGFYKEGIVQLDYSPEREMTTKELGDFTMIARVFGFKDLPGLLVGSGALENGTATTIFWKDGKQVHQSESNALFAVRYGADQLFYGDKSDFYLFDLNTHQSQLISSHKKQTFFCAEVDPEGRIWLGAVDGLWIFDQEGWQGPPHEEALLDLRINDLFKYQGAMLLATLGGGLMIKTADSLWQITDRNGLASDFCNAVTVDEEGITWVSTNKGLSRIKSVMEPSDQLEIINYTQSNGLLTSEVEEVVVQDSLVWVKSHLGLSVFNKYSWTKAGRPPPVYIQQFSIDFKDTTIADGHQIKYGRSHVQIGFAGLSYQTEGKLLYKYQLLGLDSSWQYTDQTQLVYPRLPPGQYTFSVMAQDHRGQWSDQPAQVRFIVQQPFWRSWWFIIGSIALGFGLLQLIFTFRLRLIKNRALLLQRSLMAEQKALQAQLNPHFIFNTIASIQELILSKEYKLAKQNLTIVARLIRKILDHSRRSMISLAEEIECLEIYLQLEQLRFGEQLHWSIRTESNVDQEMTDVPPMLIQPMIENAIWHGLRPREGEGGRLEVLFFQKDEALYCEVKDNGIGREKAAQLRGNYAHQPLGMKIIEERIELLNANRKGLYGVTVSDLRDEAKQVCGTCVTIRFSLN